MSKEEKSYPLSEILITVPLAAISCAPEKNYLSAHMAGKIEESMPY